MEIEIDSENARILLKNIESRSKDLSKPMRKISIALENSVKENFRKGGRFKEAGSIEGGSNEWEKTKTPPLYKSGKQKDKEKGTTLLRSGHLMRSITPEHNEDSASVSSGMVYARIHNYGGQAGRGKKVTIPARPFMVIQNDDIEYAKETILDHIKGD